MGMWRCSIKVATVLSLLSGGHAGYTFLSVIVPSSDHAQLAANGYEYDRIGSGNSCEDNAGWESIYSVSECMYASNLFRCFLDADYAYCGPGWDEPCGCSYNTSANVLSHTTWDGNDYTAAAGCSTTHTCLCRSPVDGSYQQVTNGTGCCDHGLEPIQGPVECKAAGNLLNMLGETANDKCNSALIVADNSAEGSDGCDGSSRAAKCSNWQRGSEYPGYAHYLGE